MTLSSVLLKHNTYTGSLYFLFWHLQDFMRAGTAYIHTIHWLPVLTNPLKEKTLCNPSYSPPFPTFNFLLFMYYHHQHQHSPSCLMIGPAFHPWVVPEQICRGWVLPGGEGCKAGMAALRGGSTLTQELATLTADISLERVSQVAGSHPFLSLIRLAYSQPLTVPLPHLHCASVQVCDTHGVAWFKV